MAVERPDVAAAMGDRAIRSVIGCKTKALAGSMRSIETYEYRGRQAKG